MDAERTFLTVASAVMAFIGFSFFFAAPSLGYPLDSDQSQRLIQIILPVLFGYLGLAARYATSSSSSTGAGTPQNMPFFKLISRGALLLFAAIIIVIAVVFGYSNRKNGIPGAGMSMNQLTWAVTFWIGFLSLTTTVIVDRLFR
jgi:hypothetical protein